MKGGRVKSQQLKYNPITSSGEVLLPGRHACNCECRKHPLINNCLKCGRIVCEQERSGPCFTCGHLVCSPKEQEQISRMSKAGTKLYNKLMSQANEDSKDPSLQTALSHRDKLLEYDQTVERRTKVIDDQNDYFQTDSSWLSTKERTILNKKKEELKELMHGRKKNIFTLDFAEKKVIEEKPTININVDELLKPDMSIFECEDAVDVDLPEGFVPTYEGEMRYQNTSSALYGNEVHDKLKHIRIQDNDLQEMSDEGMCLSLHQPYASLLVAGIKKHEGRDWYTNHRGRLWIHSAGKAPSSKDIAEVQKAYKHIAGNCKFPESYPPGVLLGCVDIVDCLPQEEYKIQFPHGEIASPYVFICVNARELNFKFPMQGKHKIFKLDGNVHQAAKKTLR